jgi:phage recombination protein Bet
MTGTSLIATMAAQRGMDPVQFARTIRRTVMPSEHTEEQFAAFMLVANRYGLDPLTREIYAYPGRKGGGINPVVSLDGWVNLVNSHPQADGFEFTYERKEGKLVSCTCTMWRKDRTHPIRVTENFAECYRNTDPWNQMPGRMLRHKAFKEAARLAFGFAGIMDEDEARDTFQRAETEVRRIDPQPAAIAADLDRFAAMDADVVEEQSAGGASTTPVPSSPDDAAGAPLPPQPPAPADALLFEKSIAIEAMLDLAHAADDEDERLADLNRQWPIYQAKFDKADPQFLGDLFATAEKVARGEMKMEEARKHLEK